VLATRLGHAAAELLAGGKFGRMIAMQHGKRTDVAIEQIAHQQRLVPLDDPLIIAARAIGTCMGD